LIEGANRIDVNWTQQGNSPAPPSAQQRSDADAVNPLTKARDAPNWIFLLASQWCGRA